LHLVIRTFPGVEINMKTVTSLDIFQILVSRYTADLSKWLNSVWAVAMIGRGDALEPLFTYGENPNPEACSGYTAHVLSGRPAQARPIESDWFGCAPDSGIPAIICPVYVLGEIGGALAIGPKNEGQRYDAMDRELMADFAEQIASLISQCETARQRTEEVAGLDYCGEDGQAGNEGSGCFDLLPIQPSALLFSVGDASMQGTAGAIVMAGLRDSLRDLASRTRNKMAAVVGELNRMAYRLGPAQFYASMFYGRIDAVQAQLQYVNAGHPPALLIRKRGGRSLRLGVSGAVLGLSARLGYSQRNVPLEDGDLLIAFSEGMADAGFHHGHGVHEQIALRAVREKPRASSSELARSILTTVNEAAPARSTRENRSVIVVRFLGAALGVSDCRLLTCAA
jgi:hypothetical protein